MVKAFNSIDYLQIISGIIELIKFCICYNSADICHSSSVALFKKLRCP
jgi:hypothetical protein